MFHESHDDMIAGFLAEVVFTLETSRDRMLHAAGQLSDHDLWWRPHEEANAVGNIMRHVCGNLRQWIIAGVGGSEDVRDRPNEFLQRRGPSGVELAQQLRQTVSESIRVIRGLDESALLTTRHIQHWPVTGLGAVMHSMTHFEGHAQEIIYVARLRLGSGYRFKDVY